MSALGLLRTHTVQQIEKVWGSLSALNALFDFSAQRAKIDRFGQQRLGTALDRFALGLASP